jgi:hypothetical protein
MFASKVLSALFLSALATASPVEVQYPEFTPGPGLPSLAELNLTIAELHQPPEASALLNAGGKPFSSPPSASCSLIIHNSSRRHSLRRRLRPPRLRLRKRKRSHRYLQLPSCAGHQAVLCRRRTSNDVCDFRQFEGVGHGFDWQGNEQLLVCLSQE